MQKYKSNIILVGLLLTISLVAQATEYEDKIIESSPELSARSERSQFISMALENDSFTGGDCGYTSGVLFSYFDSNYRPVRVARWLNNNLPLISFNDATKISYSLGQNLYTPDHISIPVRQPNDRPWAAFLYGTMRALTLTDNYVDDLELTLGVVGPAAIGEQTQKFVHKIGHADKPKGWQYQLRNEPGVVLTWGRRQLNVLSTDIHPLSLVVEPNFSISVGNVYTLAEVGAILRIMPISSYWVDTPLLIRPSMPGSSFFYSKQNRFTWYLFAGVQGRGVLRNIFLDGNTFKDSDSVDKKPFVMDLNAGLAIMYEKIRLSYTLIHRTKEFKTQPDSSLYSNINISYSID